MSVGDTEVFGFHVNKFAFVIGCVGSASSCLMAVWFAAVRSADQFLDFSLCLLAFGVYLLVIVGNHTERRSLYRPFFFVIPICIIAQICMSMYLSIIGGVLMVMQPEKIMADVHLREYVKISVNAKPLFGQSRWALIREMGILLEILGWGFFGAAVLQSYFCYVVVLASIYLKKKRRDPLWVGNWRRKSAVADVL